MTTKSNPLAGRDLLSILDLKPDELTLVMQTAAEMEARFASHDFTWLESTMLHRILATLFYEPSTRTRFSFESAMLRLGGQVISSADAAVTSSAAKGETLKDTGRMLDGYADIAVIRNKKDGSAAELASGARIPVINGGDGKNEHPTQTALDLYTLLKEFNLDSLDKLAELRGVALIGDLKRGRTVHSLSLALARLNVPMVFVSPAPLAMPEPFCAKVGELSAVDFRVTDDLAGALSEVDAAYMTRVQLERIEDEAERAALEQSPPMILTRELVMATNRTLVIMHPLPRVDEITEDVDDLAGAAYFRQAQNGLSVRMALLALLTGAI